MHQSVFLSFFKTYLGTSRLKISCIGYGRNFTVPLLAGKPYFQINRFRSREAQVPAAKLYNSMRQSEGSEHVRGILHHHFKYFITFIRVRDGDHFNFVKLMLPDHSPCIAPCTPCFFSETGSISGHQKGQFLFVYNFIIIEICQWNFSCRNQIKIFIIYLEEVISKFWQLAGTLQHFCIIHKRDAILFKPFFPVRIKKKVYQCSFQPGSIPPKHGESAFGKLHASLKIDPAIVFCQCPVFSGLKIKTSGLKNFSQLYILLFISTFRYRIVRKIRNGQCHFVKSCFCFSGFILKDGYFLLLDINFCFQLSNVFALALILAKQF